MRLTSGARRVHTDTPITPSDSQGSEEPDASATSPLGITAGGPHQEHFRGGMGAEQKENIKLIMVPVSF